MTSPTDEPSGQPTEPPANEQPTQPAGPSLQKPADPPQQASPAYGGDWTAPAAGYGPVLSSGTDYPPQPAPYPAGYGYQAVLVGGHPLAPQSDRLLARLIDGAILLIPNFVVTLLFMAGPIIALALAQVDQPIWYVLAYLGGFSLALLINLGVAYWYEVGYQHQKGQTFGKRKMRIQILALEAAQPAGTKALQRRFLAEYWVSIVMVIPVLGLLVGSVAGIYTYLNYLWCLWDKPYQQCLHDKYAKTVVIKVAE